MTEYGFWNGREKNRGRRVKASGFDAACDGVGFALFDFFVITEDFAKTAFEKLPQTSDGDDVKRAARFQVAQRIEQVNIQHLLTHFGRDI